MGKAKGGFLTPKAIANRIKAKGLQKLRWYCQMCQKQCRDEVSISPNVCIICTFLYKNSDVRRTFTPCYGLVIDKPSITI